MRYDSIVSGGVLVTPRGLTSAAIGIINEKIVSIEPDLSEHDADRTIDASGCLVFPGFIDAHNHPVYEDRFTGISGQLALGGVTSFVPFMPLVPEWGTKTDARQPVLDFIAEAERDSYLDFNAHAIIQTDTQIDKVVPAMVELGVRSAKFFTCFSERGMMVDDLSLCEGMALLAKHGCLAMVHTENESIVTYLEQKLTREHRTQPMDYPSSRPNIAEAEAAFRVLAIAETTGCPTYLVHLSARESLDVVRWFRKRDTVPIYAETCVHYLVFTEDELGRQGALVKIAPPFRRQPDVDAMWEAVKDGTIDVVSSDGSGRTTGSKAGDNIFRIPSGMPGAQSLLPLTYWEGIDTGRITLQRLAWVLSEQPARVFGLYPRKGALTVGADADLVIFDPAAVSRLTDDDLFGDSNYSPYIGRGGLGTPKLTMQRGVVILENGRLQVEKGHGQFIPVGDHDALTRIQFPGSSADEPLGQGFHHVDTD
jgi:dihydroorotase-like cyclic amidohydrolase